MKLVGVRARFGLQPDLALFCLGFHRRSAAMRDLSHASIASLGQPVLLAVSLTPGGNKLRRICL